jgi:hypothetical protein
MTFRKLSFQAIRLLRSSPTDVRRLASEPLPCPNRGRCRIDRFAYRSRTSVRRRLRKGFDCYDGAAVVGERPPAYSWTSIIALYVEAYLALRW